GASAGGPPSPGAGGGKGRARAGQGATVHVLESGQLKAVPVQLGITDSRNTELVSGELAEGARIVVGENGGPAKAPSSVGMRMF
ncbi:MAG: efflux RND transporter periplasmic adaptor subunit, partial [Dechloromonas sp.]|nr:efflux RND transporter periplasmic adaptor subunit [Dechloromonas sp.]